MTNTLTGNWRFSAEQSKVNYRRRAQCSFRVLTIDTVHEDPRATNDERVTELENENSALRQQLKALEQAIQRRSPMRKTLLKTSISSAMSLDNTTPEQELHLGSPTKKKTAKISTGSAMSIDNAEAEIAGVRLEGLSLENRPLPKTPAKTPKPKQRKLTTRKWDLATDD